MDLNYIGRIGNRVIFEEIEVKLFSGSFSFNVEDDITICMNLRDDVVELSQWASDNVACDMESLLKAMVLAKEVKAFVLEKEEGL